MNYKSFNLGDWIGHISGVIEDETTLDGNEMRDLVEFLSTLERESCEDCVSRQAVHNMLEDIPIVDTDKWFNWLQKACLRLTDLPSVTPTKCIATVKFSKDDMRELIDEKMKEIVVERKKGKWIPCSEKLPEEMGTYMTTIDYGEHGLVAAQRYYYGRDLKWNDECVIAWMPLPDPYKAGSEDKE